jgi:hypothetical protein
LAVIPGKVAFSGFGKSWMPDQIRHGEIGFFRHFKNFIAKVFSIKLAASETIYLVDTCNYLGHLNR